VGKQQQTGEIHFRAHVAKLHDDQNERSRLHGISLVQFENDGYFYVLLLRSCGQYILGLFNDAFLSVKVV
jgi:hypothetical protein